MDEGQSAAHYKKTISYSNIEFNFDSKKFHQTMFSSLKLHIITTPRRHIFLTKAVILSSTRNFFATIATHCNNMPLQVKNTTIVYVFCLHSHTVTDLLGNTCFLQQVKKVMSLGCNWLILIHVVYFISWYP